MEVEMTKYRSRGEEIEGEEGRVKITGGRIFAYLSFRKFLGRESVGGTRNRERTVTGKGGGGGGRISGNGRVWENEGGAMVSGAMATWRDIAISDDESKFENGRNMTLRRRVGAVCIVCIERKNAGLQLRRVESQLDSKVYPTRNCL